MPRSRIVALDLGTTGNRVIAFDSEQRIAASGYKEFPQIFPRPGWVEHDGEAIWKSARVLLDKVLTSVREKNVAAIGITNQRETVLIWDRRTGRPIHNAIVWQCRRTAETCRDLARRGASPLVRRKTGLVIDAYFSATKIAWLLDHVPGARRRAERGELLAGTIDTWIVWKLTGGRSHVTDTSNASRTLLFDLETKSWDEGLCRLFRVPRALLPKIVPSSANNGMFYHGIPITGIVGDQQGALFGQGCFKPGLLKNTYGTGLFAMENTGTKRRFSKNLLTTVAWSLETLDKTEYALEGSVFIGGAAVQWLRDNLRLFKKAGDTEALAKKLSSNEGVYFVPALVGLGAPYWDPRARGTILGLTRGTTRAHLARAALEAMAYQTRDILELMARGAKTDLKKLMVDGKASQNDLLMQFQADLLGIPVERPKVLETTALGAAGLAGIAVGFWRSKEHFARSRRVDKRFFPRHASDRERMYAKWKQAVARSRVWAD